MDGLSTPGSNAEMLSAIEGAELLTNDPIILQAIRDRLGVAQAQAGRLIQQANSRGRSADDTARTREAQSEAGADQTPSVDDEAEALPVTEQPAEYPPVPADEVPLIEPPIVAPPTPSPTTPSSPPAPTEPPATVIPGVRTRANRPGATIIKNKIVNHPSTQPTASSANDARIAALERADIIRAAKKAAQKVAAQAASASPLQAGSATTTPAAANPPAMAHQEQPGNAQQGGVNINIHNAHAVEPGQHVANPVGVLPNPAQVAPQLNQPGPNAQQAEPNPAGNPPPAQNPDAQVPPAGADAAANAPDGAPGAAVVPGAPAAPAAQAPAPTPPTTVEREVAHNAAVELMRAVAVANGERRERTYGAGRFGRVMRWFTSSFERCAESDSIDEIGSITQHNARVSKWKEIGLKFVGGAAAVSGTLLAGTGLLAGAPAAAFFTGLAYSMGLKVGITGLIHAAQELKWGNARAKDQINKQAEVTLKMDDLRRLITEGGQQISTAELTTAMTGLWGAHKELSETEFSKLDAEQKEAFTRNLASSGLTLATVFLVGAPSLIADVDKAATLADPGKQGILHGVITKVQTAFGVKASAAPTVLSMKEHAVLVRPAFENLFSGGALVKSDFLLQAASNEYGTAMTAAKLAHAPFQEFGSFWGLKTHAMQAGAEAYKTLLWSLAYITGSTVGSHLLNTRSRNIEERARQRVMPGLPRRFTMPPPEHLANPEPGARPPQNPPDENPPQPDQQPAGGAQADPDAGNNAQLPPPAGPQVAPPQPQPPRGNIFTRLVEWYRRWLGIVPPEPPAPGANP
jgi:hypothetical protein